MNKIITILMFLCLTVTINAQKNYPVFSIEECGAACLIENEPIMFSLESVDGIPKLVMRDLSKGEVIKSYESKLPDNTVSHIVANSKNGLLYFITIKKHSESDKKLLDAIYSFSPKKEKLEIIYTEQEETPIPISVDVVGNKLVLSISVFSKQPIIFNLETKEFEPFSDDENLRMLCAAPEQNGFVVLNFTEFDKDDNAPFYFMSLDKKLSQKLGVFNSTMRISTEEEENSLPGFSITNSDYNWITEVYNLSGFPHAGFSIATRAGLAEKYSSLANKFDISNILTANSNYLVASGKGETFVYNTKNITLGKPQTVSENDLKLIEDCIASRVSYQKKQIASSVLPKVFLAEFHLITETTKLDEYGYTESSFIVFKKKDKYAVLKNKPQLLTIVNTSFKLGNNEDAILFQDALNMLYPPGTFEKKHISFYKNNNEWFFVRNISFDKKEGFIVSTDSNKKITEIKYKLNMDEL
ncbi:MAG: hypothetical protein JEY94_08560 [Melioribacteraceae bacterium]|nr:hypothetical protein [Melioribacteraceae bacterium]